MSSFLQKATPFFEHIVIGLAFASMGYLFFWTFNTSFLSILGMAAVCFGGLKILIGVIIYGAWIFALVFRPDYLKEANSDKRTAERKEQQHRQAMAGDQSKKANWLRRNVPFVAKYWATILELGILLTGFLIIVVTKTGV
ncbi:MAG TPA: hypothetical protein VK508_07950 [Cyclobacteriaceae bacterium]|nr:hypothetical protein [Cyclobacteriaceae bacterium]